MVWFGQNCSRPSRQLGQVLSESTMQPIAARSPGLYLVTADPTLTTRPTISWPGTTGKVALPHSLRATWRSVWQMPQKRISSCTSCSVRSRRGIRVEASGDVALAAE
jgi:hypothetical protein